MNFLIYYDNLMNTVNTQFWVPALMVPLYLEDLCSHGRSSTLTKTVPSWI